MPPAVSAGNSSSARSWLAAGRGQGGQDRLAVRLAEVVEQQRRLARGDLDHQIARLLDAQVLDEGGGGMGEQPLGDRARLVGGKRPQDCGRGRRIGPPVGRFRLRRVKPLPAPGKTVTRVEDRPASG